MHVKITKEQHERLVNSNSLIKEYKYGSHLFDMANENSDIDLLRIYDPTKVFNEVEFKLIDHLPNIHSFQYDDVDNNTQIVWITPDQFWKGAASGDGIINLDICIFYDLWDVEQLFTYNIIKAYLGIAKRDLKQFHKAKKLFHAHKSLYIANCLMEKERPSEANIREIGLGHYTLPANILIENEKHLRIKLNKMLDDGLILHYHIPINCETYKTEDSLLLTMVNANNVREFKYD